MSVRLVVEETGFGIRAAMLIDDRLVEIRDQDRGDPAVTEALFAARVGAVDPKLNAAFIECGLPQPALLVAKDARAAAGVAERLPIRQLLREGQRLVVQGLREAAGGKGARVTSDVKLFGFALVYAPVGQILAAAGQPGRRQGEALRERALALFPDGRFALRRHAAQVPDDVLRAEAIELEGRWRRMAAAAAQMRPGRLSDEETALARLLRGLAELGPARLEIADRLLRLEAERLLAAHATLPRLELVELDPEQPAFTQTGVDAELDVALGSEVPLAGGGRLLIEPTAACVAIDVDGGGRAPLDVDLAATAEIARQVRLRNLGGTIVVDFVDLPSRPERQRLEEALRKAFRHDPAPLEIHAMSSLGLVTMSRARRGASLADRFLAPCARCTGSGRELAPRIAAERVLALLRAEAAPVARVRVAPAVKALLDQAPAWRAAVGRLGYAPGLVGDSAMHGGEVRLEAEGA